MFHFLNRGRKKLSKWIIIAIIITNVFMKLIRIKTFNKSLEFFNTLSHIFFILISFSNIINSRYLLISLTNKYLDISLNK